MYYFVLDKLVTNGTVINSFTPKSAKFKTEETILNFILQNCQKQTVPHGSTSQ